MKIRLFRLNIKQFFLHFLVLFFCLNTFLQDVRSIFFSLLFVILLGNFFINLDALTWN